MMENWECFLGHRMPLESRPAHNTDLPHQMGMSELSLHYLHAVDISPGQAESKIGLMGCHFELLNDSIASDA